MIQCCLHYQQLSTPDLPSSVTRWTSTSTITAIGSRIASRSNHSGPLREDCHGLSPPRSRPTPFQLMTGARTVPYPDVLRTQRLGVVSEADPQPNELSARRRSAVLRRPGDYAVARRAEVVTDFLGRGRRQGARSFSVVCGASEPIGSAHAPVKSCSAVRIRLAPSSAACCDLRVRLLVVNSRNPCRAAASGLRLHR